MAMYAVIFWDVSINLILVVAIMWVLWVATGGEAAYTFNYYFPAGCIYANVGAYITSVV
jgi:hypothetical protein